MNEIGGAIFDVAQMSRDTPGGYLMVAAGHHTPEIARHVEAAVREVVLAPAKEGAGEEERTEVPRSQAEALLPICAGKVGFECTIVPLRGDTQALLQRFCCRGSSPSVHDERPAGGSDGASLTERLAPSIVSVQADDLMAGLAEALKDIQPTRSAPDADDVGAREDAPVERPRPRLLKGGWR